MPAITTSADGAKIFLALETTGGAQLIARASRVDLSAWSAAYQPGAGSAANVVQVGADPDKVIFYGNFGTGVGVIVHTISSGANANKSPASLGAKVINTLTVNPSDANEMWCTVDTDQDLLHTTDGGATWTALNTALGFNATGLAAIWLGYWPDRGYVGGKVGAGNLDLLFSPNEFSSASNNEGATLGAADGIIGIEAVQV